MTPYSATTDIRSLADRRTKSVGASNRDSRTPGIPTELLVEDSALSSAQREEHCEAIATLLADRLEEAFSFHDGGGKHWIELASRLRYAPVPLAECSPEAQAAIARFSGTEFAHACCCEAGVSADDSTAVVGADSPHTSATQSSCTSQEAAPTPSSAAAESSGGTIYGSIITRNLSDHRLSTAEWNAYTWCFFDALLLSILLPSHGLENSPVVIHSRCRETATSVSVEVDASGITAIHPQQLWVSLPIVFHPGTSIREDFCCRSRAWAQIPPPEEGVCTVPLPDAYRIAQLTAIKLGLLDAAPSVAG